MLLEPLTAPSLISTNSTELSTGLNTVTSFILVTPRFLPTEPPFHAIPPKRYIFPLLGT